MDLNEQLQPVIAGIVENLKVSIETELREKITNEIAQKIANTEFTSLINQVVQQQLEERLYQFNFAETTESQLNKLVSRITNNLNETLIDTANQHILAEINKRIATIDINSATNHLVQSKLEHLLQIHDFPEGSINHTSVNWQGVVLSGDNIKGGIIEKFGSTGIEDLATSVKLTVMDTASVFEGPVIMPSATVKGAVTVEGDLIVKGTIPNDSPAFTDLIERTTQSVKNHLNTDLFMGFSNIVHSQILNSGLDLNRITQNGREVIKDSQLGYHITDSNLQRVGVIRDLQTSGEALLSDTLYVTSDRVGINTMDPSATLAIWDEEVELVATKRKTDVGFIGTTRNQQLVLGSNNKENIVLNTDGSVAVQDFTVGKIKMSSSPTIPNFPGQLGQVLWNENPSLGGPMGWVCLGATRWANFGIID